MKVKIQVIFKGKVQGVGFRWTLVEHAERFSLVGTVANLANGDVELFAEGEKETLQRFLKAVQDEPGLAKINEVKCSYHLATAEFSDFRIKKK